MSTRTKQTEPVDVTTPGRRRRLALSITTVAVLACASAGCGSDSKDAAPTTSAAPTTTAAAVSTTDAAASSAPPESLVTGDGAAFDAAAYCPAELNLETTGAASGDPDEDPVAAATALLAVAEPVAALAPAELADDFAKGIATLHEVIVTKNGALMDSIDLHEVHVFDLANCGWNTVKVEMTSYHFMGVPDTLVAGDYSFEVANQSADPHVLVIVRKQDGVTASWEELLAAEGEPPVDTLAGAFAVPGGSGYAVAHLEPGEYLALCPIQEGTTLETEGTGPPHFTLGMQQPFTVTSG